MKAFRASIWIWAWAYFVAYVPFSLLAKGISRGLFSQNGYGLDGPILLPLSMTFSVALLFGFWAWAGWWQDAAGSRPWRHGRIPFPRPRLGTWLSGLCVAGISASTTLAFTFDGVSIMLAMLLMRGGVLLMGPLVDRLLRRRIERSAWLGFALTLLALLLPYLSSSQSQLPVPACVTLAVYLGCYFARFGLMTGLAKSDDPDQSRRFFVEEQMVGNGLLILLLVGFALFDRSALGMALSKGFVALWQDTGLVLALLGMGLCSAGTGMAGSLIFLDARENTFCIPINRASSLLAGLVASLLLYLGWGLSLPGWAELLGAALVVVAIGLSYRISTRVGSAASASSVKA